MKICRIVDFFPTKKEIVGDLGPNYYYYSKGCAEKEIEQHIICSRKEGQPEYEELDKIKIHRVATIAKHPRRDMLFGNFGKKSLEKVLEIKPEIVHGHNAFHFYICGKKQKLQNENIKLITHLHGMIDGLWFTDFLPYSFDFKRALSDRMLALTYFYDLFYTTRAADLVIACDNSTKQSVRRYFKTKDVEVIYNGVDLNVFKNVKTELKKELNADNLLLNIGRPVPWKGVQYLLRAVKHLNPEYPNLKCLVIGAKRDSFDIYYKWLESERKKLDLENVLLRGIVPYFELPKYYSAADCFVAPSYPDPGPKTVYEAQACNCPIAGTDGGGIPEIFSPESGLLFKKRDAKDLAKKISIILDNPEKFRNGRNAVRKKATWEKCVEDIVKVYGKML